MFNKRFKSLVFRFYSRLVPHPPDTKAYLIEEHGEDVKTLLGLLERAAKLWPTHGITFKDTSQDGASLTITYAELLSEATANAARLRASGAALPHKRVVLYFDTHYDNTVWFWSVVAAGGVPALLSPLSSNEVTLAGELENINNLFEGPTVVTSKHLSPLFKLIPSIKTITVQTIALAEVEEESSKGVTSSAIKHRDELAAILFTSGSTGFSKGVEYTHTQLVCSSKLKSAFHGMDSNKTFLSWVSLDHSAALCENHLHAMYAGANQVMVPSIDFVREPVKFWQALSDFRISYTFAPNFFIATALRSINEKSESERREMKLDFSALHVIMCGGEANKTATLEAAEQFLTANGAAPCSVKASYGLSETCSALFYNLQSPVYDVKQKYIFASVGKPLPQHQLRLVDENQEQVKVGENGAIQIKGAIVFGRYFNNSAATSACMTDDGWFDTGDLGMLDEQGNLRIVGRSKEVLIINGQNYSSFELEHAIESANVPGLNKSYTASFSIWTEDEKADSEDIVVLFNPADNVVEDSPGLRETIIHVREATIRFCRKQPVAVIPLPKSELPKSTIGKLSRAKLKKAYQAGRFDKFKLSDNSLQSNAGEGTPLSTPLQNVLSRVLCDEAGVDASRLRLESAIADMNIDSLGYLRIKSSLEKELDFEDPISMSLLLRCRTIQDLDNMLLALGTTTVDYDPIVPLVTAGSKTPLILCHPGGGEFLTWLGLLKYLPDRPVFAFRVRGFHKNETPFSTLDEMLETYIAGIKRYCPNGPYALLGLCFGGMLAFELGKRLEAAGEQVAFCGGIDNPADLTRIQVRERQRNFIIDLLYFFQFLDYDTAMNWEREMTDVPDDEFAEAIFARFPDGTLESVDLTVAKVNTWLRINESMQYITRSYVPSGAISKYDLFWVPPLPQYECTTEEWRHEWLAKWKEHVRDAAQVDVDVDDSKGTLRYHRVHGTHFTILKPENIEVFQASLNEALEARGI